MSSERQAPLASCVTFCSALVPRGRTTRKRVRNRGGVGRFRRECLGKSPGPAALAGAFRAARRDDSEASAQPWGVGRFRSECLGQSPGPAALAGAFRSVGSKFRALSFLFPGDLA